MYQHRGIWLPDGEAHLQEQIDRSPLWGGLGTYQFHKLRRAMAYLPRECRRVALDVGAHVGLWTRVLATLFQHTHAFEPAPGLLECWRRNCGELPRVTLWTVALGAAGTGDGVLPMRYGDGNSGNTRYAPDLPPHFWATLTNLDALDAKGDGFGAVDFIKIDVEGYEEQVVRGAEFLIHARQPLILVEQKPGAPSRVGQREHGALRVLEEWGYRVAWDHGGDFLCVPSGYPGADRLAAHWSRGAPELPAPGDPDIPEPKGAPIPRPPRDLAALPEPVTRLSVHRDDPGYREDAQRWRVTLDGRPVRNVYTADASQGVIYAYQEGPDGQLVLGSDGRLVQIELRGTVRLFPPGG